eukprot:TRINITY_DN5396_c0_g1_i3.p1 TRINITY_DN5396_c0_g1~~TRINITY_DN5396_c0_g1_i3.p1  ORF type:complete len:771 (-),score=115.15 TRINITY_DN5396_c0_g1_i3:215-2527(-)
MYETFQCFLVNLLLLAKTKGKKQIQACIAHFVIGTPLPPRGEKDISFQIDPAFPSQKICRPPINRPLYPEISCYRMFAWLPEEHILECFLSIMNDKKLIIHSNCRGMMTEIAQSLVSFMYPFTWQHIFLPILSEEFLGLVQSPTPYIIGVDNTVNFDWREIEECLVLYVERKKIYYHFPESKKYREFSSELISDAQKRQFLEEIRAVKTKFNLPINPDINILSDRVDLRKANHITSCYHHLHQLTAQEHDQFVDEMRKVFLDFNVRRFKDYRNYLIMNRSNPSDARMDEEGYIAAEKDQNRGFLYLTLQSQGFRCYVRECAILEDQPDSLYFDQTIQKSNRSWFFSSRPDTSFIDTDIFASRTTQMCPVPPVIEDEQTTNRSSFPTLESGSYPQLLPVSAIESKMANLSSFAKLRSFTDKEKATGTKHLTALQEKYAKKYDKATLTDERCRATMKVLLNSRSPDRAFAMFYTFMSGPNNSSVTLELVELAAVALNQLQRATIGIYLIELYQHQRQRLNSETVGMITSQVSVQDSQRRNTMFSASFRFDHHTSREKSATHGFYQTQSSMLRRVMGDSISLSELLPGSVITVQGECPYCGHVLTTHEIRRGWSSDPDIPSTKCICGKRFNPSLNVTSPLIRGYARQDPEYLESEESATSGQDSTTDHQSSADATYVEQLKESRALKQWIWPSLTHCTMLSLPSLLMRLDRILAPGSLQENDGLSGFVDDDPELFWNLILFACEWDYPLDTLISGVDWNILRIRSKESIANVM